MKPKSTNFREQFHLFRESFRKTLNPKHELFQLADKIDWNRFEVALADTYSEKGRPASSLRLLVGLLYLKYTFNVSDEDLEARWVENPYWQYFCGYDYMQHVLPVDITTMIKWRKRVGAEKLRELLTETIDVALRENVLEKKEMVQVNIDTTVQEKNITHPTDSKTMLKLITKLGGIAKDSGVELRQSFSRLAKNASIKIGRYAHAKQFKRMKKLLKKMRTWLGRLIRDIRRKADLCKNSKLSDMINLGLRFLENGKGEQDKLYSVHEPEVKCISKGKAQKPYEFGQKISVATTNRNSWIMSVDFLKDNPYDGHTLAQVIGSVENTAKVKLKEVFVDKGYRGHDYSGEAKVHISGMGKKNLSWSLKRRKKRRSAIEPKIGHLKSDHRMGRCFLKGLLGDEINAILAGAGSNMRKMLNFLRETSLFGMNFMCWLILQLFFLGNEMILCIQDEKPKTIGL